jgi:hypothetical protein
LEEVTGSPRVSGPLAAALARGRAEYNARVVSARRSQGVDEAALLATLAALDPVVRAADACDPSRTDAVVSALVEAALELVPRGIVGPGARRPALQDWWLTVLAASPRMVCADPRRVVAATMNGFVRLAECSGARPADWGDAMVVLAQRSGDVDTWLRAGIVAAWRSGLAHTRAGALDVCAALPAELSSLVLGIEGTPGAETTARVVERLRQDPWAWPPHVASGEERTPDIRLVGLVGGFRGFGRGEKFIAPPRVGIHDGVFLVSDGERSFELHADFFGASLTPTGPAATPPHARGRLVLGEGGEVRCGELGRVFAGLAGTTSWSSTDLTLVAARDNSHQIALVALSGYGR